MSEAMPRRLRCAVYTRVSTDDGLDQEYNSIDAQRDAGHAYIASQRAEGWIPVADDYDDPAYSGGNMDRPGLKCLLVDIEAGRIDIVVVYKIDRLTRSLTDFSKMIELFERHGVSFVSVTQQFNTNPGHALAARYLAGGARLVERAASGAITEGLETVAIGGVPGIDE